MIIIHDRWFHLTIKRSFPGGNDAFLIVLKHNSTNHKYVFESVNVSSVGLYYSFYLELPESAELGEYTYYISTDSINNVGINCNYVPDSLVTTTRFILNKADFLTVKDDFLVIGEGERRKIRITDSGLIQYIKGEKKIYHNDCKTNKEYDKTKK